MAISGVIVPVRHSAAQLGEDQSSFVHPPRYTAPDAPRQRPLVEQESRGSQHADPAAVSANVSLQGFMPSLNRASPSGAQQFHALT